MKELSVLDLKLVNGGSIADAVTVGGGFGGAAGLSYGMGMGATGTASVGLAAAGAAAGAGLAGAAAAGWAAGQWLNENTPIQQVISDMLPDPSGLNYCGGGY